MIYPEVHFPMEASLRWSGAESQSELRIDVNGTPYLLRVLHQCVEARTTMLPLRSTTKPLQGWGTLHNLIGGSHQIPRATKTPRIFTRLRHTPQLNWRLPTISRSYQNSENHNNRLGHPKYPRGQALGHSKYPRVTSFSTSTSTYHRGELKPMQPMQWQEHKKCSSPPLSNPTKASNAMEEQERKNNEEFNKWIHKDLDPIGSPH